MNKDDKEFVIKFPCTWGEHPVILTAQKGRLHFGNA